MAMFMASRRGVRSGLEALILQTQTLQKATVIAPSQQIDSSHLFHTGGQRSAAEYSSSVKDPAVKPYDEMPGPTPLPLIGNVWRFLPYIGELSGMDTHQLNQYLHEKYGPVVKLKGIPGVQEMVFAYRPEDAEVVFRNEGNWPSRGELQSVIHYRTVLRKDYYEGSGGVLVEEGSKWLEVRSKANPPMMQPRISRRYVPPIGNVAQEFIDRVRTMRDEKNELPPFFINELFKWSLESIAYVALDTRLGCFAPNLSPDSESQRMIDAVGDFFELLYELERGARVWKIYPTRSWKKFVKALDVFHNISVKYVEAAIKRSKQRNEQQELKEGEKEKEESEPSVLERLLERLSAKEAAIMAQDMMLGGVDTTSYTVASALNLLSKTQDKQQLLFQELKFFLPKKDDSITEEMLENMKYLKACIKEVLRIAPPFGGNARLVVKEMVLSNYKVPPGVVVILPNMISSASEEIYPQSKRFIPERWLKSRPTETTFGNTEDFDIVSKVKKQPFAFRPFGIGPRSCIGRRFAEMEIEILLAKIIRNFCVEYNYGEMKYESKVLYIPKDPLKFKLTDRNE